MGDLVLLGVAEQISKQLRKDDSIGRYGGEEFLIIVPGVGKDDSKPVFERIRVAFEDHNFEASGNTIQLTVSLGVVSYDEQSDMSNLLNKVDLALYEAKTKGRNFFSYFGRSSCNILYAT